MPEPTETVTPTETEQPVIQNETEKSAIEQLGELLHPEEKSEQVVEEPKKEEVQPPEPVEGEQKEPQEVVQDEPKPEFIDDSIIEQYPTLKMYRGKPIKDALKAYDSLARKFTSSQQELVKLKQKQISDSKRKASDFPDPVEKPEEFEKSLSEYEKQIREDERNRLANQPEQPDIVGEVAKLLPKDTDVNKVIDGWVKFNSARIFNEFGERRPDTTNFYKQNPDVLFNEIAEFYNLSNRAEKNEMQIISEGKDLAYKNVKNAFKEGNKNKENAPNAEVNAISRSEEKLTEEDELLMKMYEKLPHPEVQK